MKKTGLIATFALAATMVLGSVSGVALATSAISRHGGDRMPDGTIYVDISPDTHKPFYTTPADAPGTYTFDKAGEYCSTLETSSHKDWRIPTENELNMEFNHRVAIGGFNETVSYPPAGWYWLSSPFRDHLGLNHFGVAHRFSDGVLHYDDNRSFASSLRCVR